MSAARAESAPAGRPDSAPLGARTRRKPFHVSGDRPLPVLPKQATSSSRRKDASKRPPLQHSSNGARHSTGTAPSASNSRSSNSNKRTSKRTLLQTHPLADRCSLALGRTESILVSAAGDVLVCRCRRSSTPYIDSTPQDSLDPMFLNILPCCDADCGGNLNLEGPWSPVFDSLAVKRQISSGEMSQASETSTFEWETKAERAKRTSNANATPTGTLNHNTPPSTLRSNRSTFDTLNRRVGNLTINTAQDDDDANTMQTDTGTDAEETTAADTRTTHSDQDATNAPMHNSISNSSTGDLSPGILPLPSFDYSHIHEGHNDMLQLEPRLNTPADTNNRRRSSRAKTFPTIIESPEEKKEEHAEDKKQPFLHGVPVFLTQLSQIRVKMVSANPLGAHVLLISEEALLFTYGLNNHGQLGIGVRSHIKDATRGFHTTPTLVTPLLENGGKTIACAAGVDHSLVVVATEGRRLHKIVQSSYHDTAYSDHGALSLSRVTSQPAHVECVDEDDAEADSVQHHQVYGFGCNEFMKIGLFSSAMKNQEETHNKFDVEEDILLPRRVALHCSVWPSQNDFNSSFPPHGIFEIAASAEHSAALVRRPTGDIEVYTWGNATLGALGIPIKNNSTPKTERDKRGSPSPPTTTANSVFPLPTVLERLSYRPHKQMSAFPRGLALGPYSTFVLLSNGKCMSFGFSAVGMLGHGYGVTHSMKPKEVFLPSNCFVSVSAGAFHVIGVTEKGEAFAWGINSNDRLGLGTAEFVSKVQDGSNTDKTPGVGIEWVPQQVECSKNMSPVIRGCAGYDCSMLVTCSGEVYSFGKRSGKLGKGELVSDVAVPAPLYGGLRLFHNLASSGISGGRADQTHKKKLGIQRMDSEGNLHLHDPTKPQQQEDV